MDAATDPSRVKGREKGVATDARAFGFDEESVKVTGVAVGGQCVVRQRQGKGR